MAGLNNAAPADLFTATKDSEAEGRAEYERYLANRESQGGHNGYNPLPDNQ